MALDFDVDGRLLVVDRGGMRVSFGIPGEVFTTAILQAPVLRARLHGAHLVLLERGDRVRTMTEGGMAVGAVGVRPGASQLCFAASGSVIVGYGGDGCESHEVSVERLGASPATWSDDAFGPVFALTCDPGGSWVFDAESGLYLRPAAGRFEIAMRVALPSPARAAGRGPDGAVWVLLEPGDRLMRVRAGDAEPPIDLPSELRDVAVGLRHIWGIDAHGPVELTHLVPPPDGEGPHFGLPSCGT